MLRGPYWDIQKTEIVCGVCGCAGIGIGIVVGCEAYRGIGSVVVIVVGCVAFECNCVVVGTVVGCLWVCFFWGVGGRLMGFGFVDGEMRVVPIVFVGQPNTLDETHAFLSY